VHRDFTAAGSVLHVERGTDRAAAVVDERPMRTADAT